MPRGRGAINDGDGLGQALLDAAAGGTTSGAPPGYVPPGGAGAGASAPAVGGVGSDILMVLQQAGINITDEYRVETVVCKKHHSSAFKMAKAGVAIPLGLTGLGAFYMFGKTHLVKKGNVGLSMNNGVPELLDPGWHLLLSPLRSMKAQVPIATERIKHETINLVTVKEGFVGLVLDRGTPILLPPGMHQWDSDTKIFQASFDLSKPVIHLGPYTLLIVHDGTVGVTHDNGRLDIRRAGYHVLKHERHIFACHLDVTDQFDELNDLDLITRDNVPVNVDCTVHFKISDPATAALEAGEMNDVRTLVMREARAAMASSVLQSTVSELEYLTDSGAADGNEAQAAAGARPGGAGAAAASAGGASAAAGALDDVMGLDDLSGADGANVSVGKGEESYDGAKGPERRGKYLTRARRAMQAIGVTLIKIAIRKIKILDSQINKKLAQQASIRVTRLEKLDTAHVESQTVDIDARARAKAEVTHADAQAQRVRIMAEARLYEASKIKEAAELVDSNRTARVLAELTGLTDVLKHTNTNTVFVGGGGGGAAGGGADGSPITQALLSNPNFTEQGAGGKPKRHSASAADAAAAAGADDYAIP